MEQGQPGELGPISIALALVCFVGVAWQMWRLRKWSRNEAPQNIPPWRSEKARPIFFRLLFFTWALIAIGLASAALGLKF